MALWISKLKAISNQPIELEAQFRISFHHNLLLALITLRVRGTMHSSVVECSLMVRKVPGSKSAQDQKYHVRRVVHLGKVLYSPPR